MMTIRELRLVAAVCISAMSASAQTKWYKFDKQFIQNNFPADSAIGEFAGKRFSPCQ